QTMAYGYGMNATPLQIARAYAALGNGDKALRPTFVKGDIAEAEDVLAPRIAGDVMKMMQTVTEPGGTATQAAILGYHVAGKTGTARISYNGTYSRRYNAFFAGLVPVDNPRFSMVVVLKDPDPSLAYTGGLVSAPVFKNVMEGALRLMDVPPDDIDSWLVAQRGVDRTRPLANLAQPNVVQTNAAQTPAAVPPSVVVRAAPVSPAAADDDALPQAIDAGGAR
ncbi:MAG: penicillin-binding protein 2, partial [Xanthomonadaceae bacterium]|nr:penicillin-binding protein 2 [Xanthomonadaceae bacterium]